MVEECPIADGWSEIGGDRYVLRTLEFEAYVWRGSTGRFIATVTIWEKHYTALGGTLEEVQDGCNRLALLYRARLEREARELGLLPAEE